MKTKSYTKQQIQAAMQYLNTHDVPGFDRSACKATPDDGYQLIQDIEDRMKLGERVPDALLKVVGVSVDVGLWRLIELFNEWVWLLPKRAQDKVMDTYYRWRWHVDVKKAMLHAVDSVWGWKGINHQLLNLLHETIFDSIQPKVVGGSKWTLEKIRSLSFAGNHDRDSAVISKLAHVVLDENETMAVRKESLRAIDRAMGVKEKVTAQTVRDYAKYGMR